MPDFLLEIGCEEIPARMLSEAEAVLGARVAKLLAEQKLDSGHTKTVTYSTPRRLAVLCSGTLASQPDVNQQLTGPAVSVGFKDGSPTPAAHAFAKKAGVDVGALERIKTPKGEYLAAKVVTKGRGAAQVLAEALPKEIAGLHWPKAMYWRAGAQERFVRPVRWLVALLDGEVVPLEFAGIHAGAKSAGHRILSGGAVAIPSPAQYKDALAAARVIADPKEREQRIRKALDELTRSIPGARWREDAALLSTVVNLTEFPSAVLGNFDREFLALPEEVLVTVMRDHQKYFAVDDASGKLAPHFLAVLNTEGDTDGAIGHGNERVLRARFNDARFFWETDQKIPLKQRVEMLKSVTFQKDLGSYYAKAERVARLADELSADLANASVKVNRNAVHEAAWLAKTDLTTELVKEFTELQGVVGGLYAKAQKHAAAVADAIYDHYKPESMEDSAPRTLASAVLSIADKADSVAGMFALGNLPTGSKDPFALRRQANGIVKTIAEGKLPLSLRRIFEAALECYKGSEAEKKFKGHHRVEAILDFLRERVEFYLRDARGIAYDVVAATLAAGGDDVVDALARAEAVAAVRESPDFEAISVSFKRMKNILRQAEEAGKKPAHTLDPDALKEEPEKALAARTQVTALRVENLRDKKEYAKAMSEISKLRPLIDAFFDKV
ncbi:MAG: glycine--tRNA ligase subunit beta, partial [Terriglobales bacterium]